MMKQQEVEDRLRNWLLPKLPNSIDVIFDHQSQTRPTGNYCMLNLTNVERIQMPLGFEYSDNTGPNAGGTEPSFNKLLCGEWEWTFSFNAYAQDAIDYLTAIKTATEIDHVDETGFAPLIIFSTSNIRRLPELIKEVWENRAQIDLFVRGIVNTEGVFVDSIEEVNVIHSILGADETSPTPETAPLVCNPIGTELKVNKP